MNTEKYKLTAADSISYPGYQDQFFSVPNDRIGTELRDGEAMFRAVTLPSSQWTNEPIEEAIGRAAHKKAVDKLFASAASKALTYDEDKAPLAHIPWAAVDEMAMVQLYGQKKYSDWNNYRKGMEVGRNLSCAIRHIRDYMNGIDLDKESGRNHLGHAMCRIAFVLQNLADGTAIDDRYKKPSP